MEPDLTIEKLKLYLQEKIDNGYHKLFYTENDYDFKTIDAINCINGLQQANEHFKNKLDKIKEYIMTTKTFDPDNDEVNKFSDTWIGKDLLNIIKEGQDD